jgi:hypothetical protein
MFKRHFLVIATTLVLGAAAAFADEAGGTAKAAATAPMRQYVIEREIPGASKMTAQELRAASAKSNAVLHELGPDIQWVQSYVAGDKLYCIYNARSEALIKRHAQRSGFPANRITPVAAVINPTSASPAH